MTVLDPNSDETTQDWVKDPWDLQLEILSELKGIWGTMAQRPLVIEVVLPVWYVWLSPLWASNLIAADNGKNATVVPTGQFRHVMKAHLVMGRSYRRVTMEGPPITHEQLTARYADWETRDSEQQVTQPTAIPPCKRGSLGTQWVLPYASGGLEPPQHDLNVLAYGYLCSHPHTLNSSLL